MKRCPVCKATLFDDMDTCYGCMYRFGSKPEWEQEMQKGARACAQKPLESGEGVERRAPFAPGNEGCLLGDFLVQLHRFLGDFLVDAGVKL